jgi:hypothetical protein
MEYQQLIEVKDATTPAELTKAQEGKNAPEPRSSH